MGAVWQWSGFQTCSTGTLWVSITELSVLGPYCISRSPYRLGYGRSYYDSLRIEELSFVGSACKYFNKKQYPLEQNQRYTVFIILYLIFNIYSILRFVLYLFLIHSCNPLFSDLSLLKAKVFTVLATLNRQSEEENWCTCTKGRWRRWREWKLIL